jgi:hypothetical protein
VILPRKALVLPTGKNFTTNAAEHLLHVSTTSLSFVEPLFRLPHEGEGERAKTYSFRCDVFDDVGVAQFKEVLQVSTGILTWQST